MSKNFLATHEWVKSHISKQVFGNGTVEETITASGTWVVPEGVYFIDRLAALDLVKKTNDTLAVTGEAFSRQESGVALRKGNEDLLKAVNDAIAEMQKDGTLQALSEKWFGADVTK